MSGDNIQAVKLAVMRRMKADAGLTGLIPAAEMYPGTVPATRAFPFTRFGVALASPFRASGLNSTALRLSVQAFAQNVKNEARAVIATAEQQIFQIGSAIKDALDGSVLTLEGGGKVRLTWIQSSPVMDPTEPGAWMTTVTFGAEVAG